MGAPRTLRRVGAGLALAYGLSSPPVRGASACISSPSPEIGRSYSFSDSDPHTFRVYLERGEVLRARFEERGLDIAVAVSGPPRFSSFVVDPPQDVTGTQEVVLVALSSDCYTLQVPAPPARQVDAGYVLAEWSVRKEKKGDRAWMAGSIAYSEGVRRFSRRAERKKAEGAFKRAAAAWRRAKFSRGEADALVKMAMLKGSDAGEATKRAWSSAATLYSKAGLSHLASVAWLSVGERDGESPEKARLSYQRAVLSCRSPSQSLLNVRGYGQYTSVDLALQEVKSLLYWAFNELKTANFTYEPILDALSAALQRSDKIQKEEKRDSYRRMALLGLAAAYSALGDVERADRFEREASGNSEDGIEDSWHVYSWTILGDLYLQSGQPERALGLYLRALKSYQDGNQLRRQGIVHNQICQALVEMGRNEEAIVAATKALTFLREKEDQKLIARVRTNVAWALSRTGRIAEARENLARVLQAAEKLKDTELRADALFGIAVLEFEQSDLRSAQDHVTQAIEIIERAGARLVDRQDRAALLWKYRDLFQLLVEILVRRQKLESGKNWAAQGLAVADAVNGRALREARSSKPPGNLDSTLSRATRERFARAQRELLDEETLLLEYVLTKNGALLWVVEAHGVRAIELEGAGDIRSLASKFREDLAASASLEPRQRAASAARRLSDILLGPAAREIGVKRRILICVPPALEVIPFSLLPAPGAGEDRTEWSTPISESHQVSFIASLTATAELPADGEAGVVPDDSLVMIDDPVTEFSDPRLRIPESPSEPGMESASVLSVPRVKNADREAGPIVKRFLPHRTLRANAFGATREFLLSDIHDYSVIHIISHALFPSGRSEESALVLSLFDSTGAPIRGLVTASEIERLSLKAQLVVLSACSTGLGKETWGEGLASLSQAFLRAGARSVLMSLWEVDDEATAELMTRFYDFLLRDRLPPAEALGKAQASLRNDPRWTSPFYWGGFVLKGDWR